MSRSEAFTPALGHAALSPLYDATIALMTREGRWRRELVAAVRPQPDDVILDVGCGTGSLAMLLKGAEPAARIVGLDPDPDILARAQRKADQAKVSVEFVQGFARDAAGAVAGGATVVVSSLVFHQVPMAEKVAGLAACHAALRSRGRLHVADYGLQRTRLMQALFRQVQRLDGVENTEPNARGVLLDLIAQAGFADAQETRVLPTPTGSISFYKGTRP